MEFERLLYIVGDEPIFESGLVLRDVKPTGSPNNSTRWTATGRLYQLRRAVFAAPTYSKVKPHPFVIANRIVAGSYVSLQSALAYYGMIPEYPPDDQASQPAAHSHITLR